jgi:hypothetical protein
MQNIGRNESFRGIGQRKKVVFVASLPDVPVGTSLFVREGCRYVGKDATIKGEMPL